MTAQLGLVFSNAVESRDDAFPGAVSERRFRLSPLQRTGQGAGQTASWEHLALYELGSDAPPVQVVAGGQASAGAAAGVDDALVQDRVAWVYAPAGPKVAEAEVAPPSKPQLGAGRHVFLAFTNPVAGREADFLAWYDIHVPEVVEHFAGLVTGQLFAGGGAVTRGMPSPWRYLALYDLVADDIAEYLGHEQKTREAGALRQNGGTLDSGFAVWIYSEVGPRLDRESAGAAAVSAGV